MALATLVLGCGIEVSDYGPGRLLVQLYLILGSTNE